VIGKTAGKALAVITNGCNELAGYVCYAQHNRNGGETYEASYKHDPQYVLHCVCFHRQDVLSFAVSRDAEPS
jgi:hypothetical protein